MIVSQTPYRVSFGGGGTDLPSFCEHEYGAVLSAALKKHMYVTVSPRFDATIRVSYTRTEIADGIDDVQHSLVREALRLTGLSRHIEVTTIGDVPAGTGLGSSSSLTVGLLNALYAYRGQITSPQQLASEACRIEIDILGKPIGRQDQYAAAWGGLNYMQFKPGGSVLVEPVPCSARTLAELERSILLLYTDQQRAADTILRRQSETTRANAATLRRMRDIANEMRLVVSLSGDLEEFARLLHEGWELKRSLVAGTSDDKVDRWYSAAREAGALGGKLLGAGGGGFLLLLAPPERHDRIREVLGHPRELHFSVDPLGSRIIFISDRR